MATYQPNQPIHKPLEDFKIDIYFEGFDMIPYGPILMKDEAIEGTASTVNNAEIGQFKIRRKKIELLSDRKMLKRIGNIPKSLIGNFYKYLPDYQSDFIQTQYYDQTRDLIGGWLQNKNDLNRWHLNQLFGKDDVHCYENRRILRRMIEDNIWKMTGLGTKVENSLTYMVCLEKYTARLVHPKLASRIQI